MFNSLSDKLELVFKKLRGQGVMTEENIKDALREVRLVLLEADVNFKVVKDFVEKVRVRAVGSQVLQSLSPGQQVIRIVHDELVALMGGGEDNSLMLAAKPPVAIMLVGLQGSGKTTTCGKLARYLKVTATETAAGPCRCLPTGGHRAAEDPWPTALHRSV